MRNYDFAISFLFPEVLLFFFFLMPYAPTVSFKEMFDY